MRNAKFRSRRGWRDLEGGLGADSSSDKGPSDIDLLRRGGKNMGAAVANFYKELKSLGMPDQAVMRMTQEHAKTFNDLGKLIRETVGQRGVLQTPKAAKEEPATQEEKDEG